MWSKKRKKVGGQQHEPPNWGSVCLGDDPISMESWNQVKMSEMPDVVTIRPEIGADAKGLCTQRDDLIRAMESNKVFKWIPRNWTEPQFGQADHSETFYKHPLGWWLDSKSLDLIKQTRPRKYSLFQLQFVDERLVGTEFGISALHGAVVPVYTLIPLASQANFTEQVRRGYVASYRRTSFERAAKEREQIKRAQVEEAKRRISRERKRQEEESRARRISRERKEAEEAKQRVIPRRNALRARLVKWTRINRLTPGDELIMKVGRTEELVRFVEVVPGRQHMIRLSLPQEHDFLYQSDNQSWINQTDQSRWKLYFREPVVPRRSRSRSL